MNTPQKFRLTVNVQIQDEGGFGGAVSIRDEVPIRQVSFAEMAEILQAFHTLIEKFREK